MCNTKNIESLELPCSSFHYTNGLRMTVFIYVKLPSLIVSEKKELSQLSLLKYNLLTRDP